MSLDEVLNNLSGKSKKSFLESFLPRASTISDDDFIAVRDAALEVSVDSSLGLTPQLAVEIVL